MPERARRRGGLRASGVCRRSRRATSSVRRSAKAIRWRSKRRRAWIAASWSTIETMIAIVRDRLLRPDAQCGFVLDGFPRTVAQAEALDAIMRERNNGPLIVVDVDGAAAGAGAAAGHAAHLREVRRQRATGSADSCPKCGGELEQRADDNQEVVLERLNVYHAGDQAGARVLPRAADVPRRQRRAAAGAGGARARHDDRRCGGAGGGAVIVCRSQAEIAKLRRVNQLVGQILAELRSMVRPGVTTRRHRRAGRDSACARRAPSRRSRDITAIRRRCARRSTSRWCTGSPRRRALVEGDIVSIDMGAKLDGFFGDCAVTVPVGRRRRRSRRRC